MNDPNVTDPVAMPTSHSGLFDPPDELSKLRHEQPLARVRYANGEVGWLVTSHSIAKAVMTDQRFGRGGHETQLKTNPLMGASRYEEFEKALEPYGDWRPMRGFIFMDPPDHTRYRRLLAPYFSSRRMEEFRPRIEHIVAGRLLAMAEAGPPADLVQDFAIPISLWSQCTLLGVPPGEVDRFFRLGTIFFDPAVRPADVVEAWRNAWDYVRQLTVNRRRMPENDLISEVAAHGELTDDEIADTALVLFQGGLETTGDMLALGAFVLLEHPSQLESLRADDSRIVPATEELLRYSGIFRLITRTALAEVELAGHRIRAGEVVTISLAAANRDPDKFHHPDELDLARTASGHVGFAQGIHMCIGQDLARIELQVGLLQLVKRFPNLRLAVPKADVPVYGPEMGNFGVHKLPVIW